MTDGEVGVLVRDAASRHGIELSEKQVGRFSSYVKLIQQWQRTVVRLVGNDDATVLVTDHVADAFRTYRCVDAWKGKRAVDIGSGAGFPGVCLKIVEPELHLTLLDARTKKVAFLTRVAADLGLDGVEVVRGRAEELAHEGEFREEFDIATMRAVARLARAMEIGLAFVGVGGVLVVRRGGTSGEDIGVAERCARRYGGGQVVVHRDAILDRRSRGSCIVVAKTESMDRRYPRGPAGDDGESLVAE